MGNIAVSIHIHVAYTVHPHGCGEHTSLRLLCTEPTGSSPRMWGTFWCSWRFCCYVRFIPTNVGNMQRTPTLALLVLVHPHECGEHTAQASKDRTGLGSSPRMWGTSRVRWRRVVHNRFIPTNVGNMSGRMLHTGACSVHPHECGEHGNKIPAPATITGSSPRMWGTWSDFDIAAFDFRFIPTNVGNIRVRR